MLGLAVAVPAVLLLLLRTDAATVFLSLAVGGILERIAGNDITSALATFSARTNTEIGMAVVHIGLIVVPAIITALVLRRSVSSAKLLVNIFPAVATGAVGLLLIVPLLPANIRITVINSNIWSLIDKSQVLIVGVSVLSSLLVLWFGKPHKEHGKKHH